MGENLCVEIPLPDGWMSMHIGRLVRRDADVIVLTDVAWISDTGRRHLFFAGNPDSNFECEPLPNGVVVELPAKGAVVTSWPHALFRDAR